LFRFWERYGISWEVVSGDEKSANINAAKIWKEEKLLEIVRLYKAEEVFSADKTAYFYKILPDRTMAYEGEKCSGGRRSKERFLVLFCCNTTGTMKLQSLVIGKHAKPRCFNGISSLMAD
jgi:hypothetical protein